MRMSLAAFALVLAVAAARAQTSSAPAGSPPASTAEASIHAYGDRDKTCLAWTDQCRSCTRGFNDEVNCSNIGIACQPAAIACTARQPEPAKPPEPAK
jgi:hypothetical protein